MVRDVETIWKEIEDSIFETYYPHEKMKKYHELLQIYEGLGNREKFDEIMKELKLLNKVVSFSGQIPDVWKWCIEHLNSPFPEWRKEDVEYYRKRFNETKNPLHKARYAYVVWTLEKDVNYANSAVKYFLETGKIYIDNGWYKDVLTNTAFYFEIAARLSLSLNLKKPLSIIDILREILLMIRNLKDREEKGRGLADLVNLAGNLAEDFTNISRLRNHVETKEIILQIMNIADEIAQKCFAEKEYGWQRFYLKTCIRFAKFLREANKVRDFLIGIAESYEMQGRMMSGSKLLESSFYEAALRVYSELGNSEKMEELKAKIAQCQREAIERGEYKEVSMRVEIPIQKFIEDYMLRLEGKTPEDIIATLIADPFFISDLEKVRQHVEEIKKKCPLLFLFPIKQEEDYGPRKIYKDENEIFEYKVKEQFNLESEIKERLLCELLKELLKEKLEPQDFINFLRMSRNVTEYSFRLIEKEILEHFNANYVASIHILIPQIEETLRILLRNHGILPVKYLPKDKVFEQRLLGALINEAEPFIGENFAEYLRVRLTMDFANIRNKVCHGWMRIEEFTEVLSFSLIYILLKLSRV